MFNVCPGWPTAVSTYITGSGSLDRKHHVAVCRGGLVSRVDGAWRLLSGTVKGSRS